MKTYGHYDVVVVGGGTAGVMAAIAAARTGAKTLLIEQFGSIGGVLSFGMGFLGASDGEGCRALGGIGGELVDRLQQQGAATRISADPLFGSVMGQDPEVTKLVLTDMALDSGVRLLLHTFVPDVLVSEADASGTARLSGIVIANKAGLQIVTASGFVDCTGDADLVARAGGRFTLGRQADARTQPASCIFRVGGVDLDQLWGYLETHPDEMSAPAGWSGQSHDIDHLRRTPGAHLEGLAALIRQARNAGDFTIQKDSMGLFTFPGQNIVGVNVTRVQGIDPTNPDDITRAEIKSRRQMMEATRFLQRYVPGFKSAFIVAAPGQIGVRESRHIEGPYVLDKGDILGGRNFDDRIGRGAYPLDIHDVGAKSGGAGGGITHFKINRSYSIPARSLEAPWTGKRLGWRSRHQCHT